MVMTPVGSTQTACIWPALSYATSDVDGYHSSGIQVVYFLGNSSKQVNENFIRISFMNSTAYKLSPNTYCFFSEEASIDGTIVPTSKQESVVSDVYEQFNYLHRFFQFRKTEWAQIFGVSRVSIYGWLNRTMEPSGANKKRIEQLFQLICEVPGISSEDTVQLYVHHHIAMLNASLFDVMSSPHAIENQRSSIIQALEELLLRSRRKKEELERLTTTKKASDATLAYNLDQLFS